MQDDLWVSALDPSFHFQHAAIDRIWSLWQAQNQTVRIQEVSNTMTIQNQPASAIGTRKHILCLPDLSVLTLYSRNPD